MVIRYDAAANVVSKQTETSMMNPNNAMGYWAGAVGESPLEPGMLPRLDDETSDADVFD